MRTLTERIDVMNTLKEALEFLGVDPEESSQSTLAFEIAEALMGQQGADLNEYSDEDEQKTEQAAEIIGEVLLAVLRGER